MLGGVGILGLPLEVIPRLLPGGPPLGIIISDGLIDSAINIYIY